jgi:hypothetical protein
MSNLSDMPKRDATCYALDSAILMLRVRFFGCSMILGIAVIGCGGDSSSSDSLEGGDDSGPLGRVDAENDHGDHRGDGGAGGAAGSDDAATDGRRDATNSGGDASDSSVDVLAEALFEGGVDDAGATDVTAASDASSEPAASDASSEPAASDASSEPASTDASDAATGTVDATAVDSTNAIDGTNSIDATGAVDGSTEDAVDETGGDENARDAGDAGNLRDADAPSAPGPLSVGITWASIANVYLELGSTSALIDGYITRLPSNDFFGGGSGLAYTHTNYSSDETAIRNVLSALGGPTRINWLFTGHSHWDHSFDTATWARLTGAPIFGSRTTCFQARAEGTPLAACTAVVGGEKVQLGPGVTVRVIRWNHSGDSTNNPEQHNPVELPGVPTLDAQGRLRAGVAEDFPNGGGSRAFLFTIESAAGSYSLFYEDSAGSGDLNQPIVVDAVDYGAPLSNLAAALTDASLTHVDLWIATGGSPVAKLVVPLLHPKAYLPVHWDGLFRAFHSGAPAFSDSDLTTYLRSQGVQLVTPVQYMDKWSLSPSGIVPEDNQQVKHALGF